MFADDPEDVGAVPLARESDVEAPRLQLEQAGQQLGVVDVRAVRRMEIVPRAGMDPDAPACFGRETREREVVQVDEAVEQIPGGVDLHGQPSLGEVHLHLVGAPGQAAPYVGFMLAQQIVDELLARVAGNALGRVHQAQGRRRYHRLLDRHVRVAHGDVHVTAGMPPVSEGAAREPREPARVAVGKRNGETIRRCVRETVHGVRREAVVLPLFAVSDDRRARRLEPLDGVPNGVFIVRSQIGLLVGIRSVAPRDPLDQFRRSGNAANGLGGYGGWGGYSHSSCRLA